MAETLTKQQLMAVKNRGGKLLVSAAAGSGKTKVLVDRLLDYLTDPVDPANIDDFLIITYTKAAASELRSKIAAKLTERIAEQPENRHLQRQIQRLYLTNISTIHSFCGDILRQYAYLLDVPADFRVADENECQQIQIQVMDQLLEDSYANAESNQDFRAFIDTQGFGRDDRQIPEIILKVYNSARCHLNPDEWLLQSEHAFSNHDMDNPGNTVWGAYLISDLKDTLRCHIDALNRCVSLSRTSEGMEKPTALLESTIAQLNTLLEYENWDDFVLHRKIDYGRLTFTKKVTDLDLAEQIKAVRNACKSGLEKKLAVFSDSSLQVITDLSSCAAAARGLVQLVREYGKRYAQKKKSRRIMDFTDLEHSMLDLVLGKSRSGVTAVAKEIGKRYREIMIDEYQDTNEVQDRIFSALSAGRNNCFMVGDVKQSIYQFRLADPDIFIEKYNTYADAENTKDGEGRKVLLSHNFRSASGVIHAVNDVFSCCMSPQVGGIEYNESEMLREGVPHIPLNEAEVELYGICVAQDTYAEEAAFTAKRIKQLLDGKHMIRQGDTLRPIREEDIVILLRSPGSVGENFRYALERLGIPCATSTGTDILAAEEISVLRSLLQIISNPIQDIPLVAVLASRLFCFTADDLAALRAESKYTSIYEAVTNSNTDKCQDFLRTFNQLRLDARLNSLPHLLQRILITLRFDSIYSALPDGMQRKANIHHFCQMAGEYESTTHRGLDSFLEHLSAMESKGITLGSDQKSSGAVTIMSIHKSKGLEFPVVFLCGLSRMFSQESIRGQVLCDKTLGLGLSCVDQRNRVRYPSIAKRAIAAKIMADSISEEMRVLYVALTRPKDRLIMTYAVKNLQDDLKEISLRKQHTGKTLMTKDVSCPGEWVLQAALNRTEAGAFFKYAGCQPESSVSQNPWKISVIEDVNCDEAISVLPLQDEPEKEIDIEQIQKGLSYQYAFTGAQNAPSKLTATQLKGRLLDMEISENTEQFTKRIHSFRKPEFSADVLTGKDLGNAMHSVMQYIAYPNCTSVECIQDEIARILQRGLITEQQAAAVSAEKIWKLFSSPMGIQMRQCDQVLREFKFSILEDSEKLIPGVHGEKILLQGVVDCALLKEDGITVIDFKTDYVCQENLTEVIERYRMQVDAYADALSRIYQQKITGKFLYLFSIDQFVQI